MSRARSPLSDEQDLSKLYNDDLAGFASEGDEPDSVTRDSFPAGMDMSNGTYSSSGDRSLKPIKSITQSALERGGGFECNGFDVGSVSGRSYGEEDTGMTRATPSTSVERGNALSSSIYSPVSPPPSQELQSRPSITVSSYSPDPSRNGESSRYAESSRATWHHEEMLLPLMSHLAVRPRDEVPKGTHVKGNIPYDRAFTRKDIVVRLENLITKDSSYFN
jgi:hypothetical protein